VCNVSTFVVEGTSFCGWAADITIPNELNVGKGSKMRVRVSRTRFVSSTNDKKINAY
jgi:hypothetical protein